jgi:cystathionine beta-lyase
MTMDYATKIVHTGHETDPYTGASTVPIYQVSTFDQNHPGDRRYEYGRGDNPTRHAVEKAVAALENGAAGHAFASGMAAISSVLLLFRPGDHLVVCEDVYGGTYRVLTTLFARWGLEVTFADFSDPERVRAALRPTTRGLFAETPSNPILKITDLEAVAAIARERGIPAIIDNTFMTPYLQRPLDHGFDIAIHSATKFLGGHSDLIAGLVVSRESSWGERVGVVQRSFGAILGPQDSFLLHRGLKTLAARMDAQQRSAEAIAGSLGALPGVTRVLYPTLPGHPGRDVHRRQASGGGAVISFELEDGRAAQRLLRRVTLPLVAVSLGGVESILSYPATMSHAAMPPEERHRRGISDGLVRLSVGLESPGDLLADLERALSA